MNIMKFKQRLNKKLSRASGETLIETLIAVLIVTLCLTMLAGAIVSAAKVNHKVEGMNTGFNEAKAVEVSSPANPEAVIVHGTTTPKKVDGSGNPITSESLLIKLYETDDTNHYRYYSKR